MYLKTILLASMVFSLQTFAAETTALCLLKADGVTENEAASLTDTLDSELSKRSKYNLMERNQMHEILKEQGFSRSEACADSGCAVEIGELLSVKFVIFGSVSRADTIYTLSLRMIDVPARTIVKIITEHHKLRTAQPVTATIPPIAEQKPTPNPTASGAIKKSSDAWVWWTSGCVVAAATIAVPVVYFTLHSNKETSTPAMEFNASW